MYDQIDHSIWNIVNLFVVYQQIRRLGNKSLSGEKLHPEPSQQTWDVLLIEMQYLWIHLTEIHFSLS